PPYVVPSSENSAVFCEIGRSCPSQNAHPVGAKLKPKMRISATKASLISSLLRLRRELAEERDDEVDDEVRVHVVVRLAAAGGLDGVRPHDERGRPLD